MSLAGRALAEGKWSLDCVQIRDFATDKHRSVDDTPAGGGAGMVLRADVLAAAVDHAVGAQNPPPPGEGDRPKGGGGGAAERDRGADLPLRQRSALPPPPEGEDCLRPILAMTPRGKPITQARIRELAAGPGVIILCGRFEGFDERIFAARAIEEVSVGDIVLSGGEPAALMVLDACIRLLPGVMGRDLERGGGVV